MGNATANESAENAFWKTFAKTAKTFINALNFALKKRGKTMAELLLNIAYAVGIIVIVCFAVVLCVLVALLVRSVIEEWRDWHDV